jgi:teichuronic acid exporter
VPSSDDSGRIEFPRLPKQAYLILGGLALISSKVVAQAFQWSITLYVATLLQPADYGLITIAVMVFGLAEMLAGLGLGRALIQKSDVDDSDLAEAFTISLGLAIGLCVMTWLIAPSLAAYVNEPSLTLLLRVISLSLLLMPLQTVCGALVERRFLLRKQSMIVVVVAMIQGFLVLGLAYSGYRIWSLAIGILGARACQSLLFWQVSGWRPRLVVPSFRGSPLIRYAVILNVGTLLWFANSNADFAVVTAQLGAAALGYYALAFQIISLPVDKLAASVNQIAFAAYCRLNDKRDDLSHAFLRIMSLLFAVCAPALVGISLVADDAVPLVMGVRWQPAVLPLQLLAPAGCLMVVASTLPPLLNSLGRPDINLYYSMLRAAVSPAVFFAMGWAGGVVGVCAAWLLLMPLFLIGLVHFTRATTGIGLETLARALLPIIGAVAAMCAGVLIVRGFLPDQMPVRLMASIAAGFVIYVVVLYFAGRDALIGEIHWVAVMLRSQNNASTQGMQPPTSQPS